jgi:cell division protein FtsW (lipid II flippase)
MSGTTAEVSSERSAADQPSRIALLLNHPLSTYYLLLGTTLLLLALGLIMVLSASSIESFRVFGSAYTLVQRQALFAGIGVILLVASVGTCTAEEKSASGKEIVFVSPGARS